MVGVVEVWLWRLRVKVELGYIRDLLEGVASRLLWFTQQPTDSFGCSLLIVAMPQKCQSHVEQPS